MDAEQEQLQAEQLEQEQPQEQTQEQAQVDELEAIIAGYDKVPGSPPEVEVDGEEDPAPVPAEPDADLMARLQKVEQLEQELHNRFQKVNNQIGNVMQQLRVVTASTPKAEVRQITADSMKKLRELGYDEIAEALAADLNGNFTQSEPVDISSAVTEAMKVRSQQELEELHPDYREAINSQEFNDWLQTLPVETQQRVMNSESLPYVSRALDNFKQWHHDRQHAEQTTQQSNKQRLENAVTPSSGRASPTPAKLPDEAGLWTGYNAGRKPLQKR